MNIKSILGILAIVLFIAAPNLHARNWVSGYTVTKVYDQRPHKQQLDINISPQLNNCSTISFIVGTTGLQDEHLDKALTVALTALASGKKVGGLWGEPQDGCIATNISISN